MKIKRHGHRNPRETVVLVSSKVTDVHWERNWHEYWQVAKHPIDGKPAREDGYKMDEKSLSILIVNEPDHSRDYTSYDYNITLSLDDIVEIVKTIHNTNSAALRKALRPHVKEILAIALDTLND